MTEVERILSKGVIPQSFLEPEIRCDYTVTEEMKKIWTVELDLLSEFKRICEKYNLRYFVFGGTMLGAVRHNGFIPWDDDIDVIMPMNDYKRLQTIAKDEFYEPYCLQTPFLDPGSYFSFMKLRNSNTTFMSKVFSAQNFNQGAFIDIFPLVECPPNKVEQQRELIYPHIMKCSNYMKKGCEDLLSDKQLENMSKFVTDNPIEDYWIVQQEFDNPEYHDCGYYTHASLFFNYNKYSVWKSILWNDITLHPFEMITIPLPIGWDKILSQYYGDYLQLPPVEERKSFHADMIIDMNKSYTEYIRKQK